MSNIKLIEGVQGIDKAIAGLKSAGAKMDAQIHIVASSVLNHCSLHNDVTVVNRLVNELVEAMPKSSRINALKAWIEEFGNVRYDNEDKMFKFSKGKVADIVKAVATPFWEFKPETEYKAFNLQAQIDALVAKAQRQASKSDERDMIDTRLLNSLRDLATPVEVKVQAAA